MVCVLQWVSFSKFLTCFTHRYRQQNLHHLHPSMGLQFGVFPPSKYLWFIRSLYILQSEHKDTHTWNPTRHAKIVNAFFFFFSVCFCVCGWQKCEYSQLDLHGWRRYHTWQYRSSGSPFYDLWLHLILTSNKWRACFQNLLHPPRHVTHLHYWLPYAIKIVQVS